MELDPVLLARIQFAFTVSFHIIFPAISIGLASFLAVIELLWLRTNDPKFKELYQFWVKIFAVTFGMGVVSGVVMAYEFGTNWSIFSDRVSNVIGPLLGFEVLTAFFLEASFLGIMLFGWEKVSSKMHFFSTCTVAIGTLISAFWILSANSWMQTPQGFVVAADGRLFPTDWLEIIFNPSFGHRFIHMILAAYLTTSFFVGSVGALYLLRKKDVAQAKTMLTIAVIIASILSPIQMFIGHQHGENTLQYQPAKIAAMEGNWTTHENTPLFLFGIPDQEEEVTKYGIAIPNGASWVLTGRGDGKVPALKDYPAEERPPVMWVFWSFRIMVGIGLLMIALSLTSLVQYFRNNLFSNKILQRCWVAMMPSGFIALLAGWFVTEIGRQPWTVYGFIKTSHSVPPAIVGAQVAWSLAIFVVAYTIIFSAGMYYIGKLINKGVVVSKDDEHYYHHGIEASVVESITHKNKRG